MLTSGARRGVGWTAQHLHVTSVAVILTDSLPHVADGPVVPDHARDSTDSPPVTTDAPPVHELATKILSL